MLLTSGTLMTSQVSRGYFYILNTYHFGAQPPSTGMQPRRIFDHCVPKEKRTVLSCPHFSAPCLAYRSTMTLSLPCRSLCPVLRLVLQSIIYHVFALSCIYRLALDRSPFRSVHRMAKPHCACAASDVVVGITEVKQHRARLVLGWVTSWEHRGCGWRDSNPRSGSKL